MPFSTSVVGVDASGAAQVYEPPNVIPVTVGYNVSNGMYQQINAGSDWPPAPGIWQMANGSGGSTVATELTYRQVFITPL